MLSDLIANLTMVGDLAFVVLLSSQQWMTVFTAITQELDMHDFTSYTLEA